MTPIGCQKELPMDNVTTDLTGKVNEKELFSVRLPPYFIAKVGSGFIIIDGLLHIAQAIGVYSGVNAAGAATSYSAATIAHATAFSWISLGWGMIILFTGLAMYRHFRALGGQND
jgi:hypothetical protein